MSFTERMERFRILIATAKTLAHQKIRIEAENGVGKIRFQVKLSKTQNKVAVSYVCRFRQGIR